MIEKEKYKKILVDQESPPTLQVILDTVDQAVREGNDELAYTLIMQAVQMAPKDVGIWVLRASLAPSLEERILCVNRLNELAPNYQDRHHIAFHTLGELLETDPYLAYLEESEDLYRVLRPDRQVLSIPKKRSTATPPPHKKRDKLTAAERWLTFAVFGLLSAGVLTLLFAPLAAWSAIQAERSVRSHAGQVRFAVVIFSSLALFAIGLFFSFLLFLHLVG